MRLHRQVDHLFHPKLHLIGKALFVLLKDGFHGLHLNLPPGVMGFCPVGIYTRTGLVAQDKRFGTDTLRRLFYQRPFLLIDAAAYVWAESFLDGPLRTKRLLPLDAGAFF